MFEEMGHRVRCVHETITKESVTGVHVKIESNLSS